MLFRSLILLLAFLFLSPEAFAGKKRRERPTRLFRRELTQPAPPASIDTCAYLFTNEFAQLQLAEWEDHLSGGEVLDPVFTDAVDLAEAAFPTGPLLSYDLGQGAGSEAIYVLQRSRWNVTAVDALPQAIDFFLARVSEDLAPKLTMVRARFERLQLPVQSAHLIVAKNSIYLLPPTELDRMFRKISHSLVRGGIFMGSVVGINNWAAARDRNHAFFTPKRLRRTLEALGLEQITIDTFRAVTPLGQDESHRFIFQKKRD